MGEQSDIIKLKERIETELTATSYGLRCIEIAFGVEESTNANSFVRTNIASNYEPTFIEFPYDNIYTGRMDNYAVARGAANRIAGMLIGTIYEVLTQDDQKYWNRYSLYDFEELQFLRWIRHGVFHSNRFKLDDYDGGAEWRGIEITQDMEDEVVFTEVDWENKRYIPNADLPRGYYNYEEDINEGFLEAGDGMVLAQTVLRVLDEF